MKILATKINDRLSDKRKAIDAEARANATHMDPHHLLSVTAMAPPERLWEVFYTFLNLLKKSKNPATSSHNNSVI